MERADDSTAVIHRDVLEILTSGFTLSEGCLLISQMHDNRRHLRLGHFENSVGYECAVNDVAIGDPATPQSAVDLAAIARQVVDIVRDSLVAEAPPGEVRVVIDIDITSETPAATVRLYQRQDRTPDWMDIETAESKGLATLIVDFD